MESTKKHVLTAGPNQQTWVLNIGRKVMDGRFLAVHVGGVDIGFQVKHWYFSEAGLFKNSGPWYTPTCKASFTS